MNKINRTQRKVGHRSAKQYTLNGVPKGEERESRRKIILRNNGVYTHTTHAYIHTCTYSIVGPITYRMVI